MFYTSLDLHKSYSYITTMNSRGEIMGFLKGFEDNMEVAIEATPSWYWLYDCLEAEGLEVKLSHLLRTKGVAIKEGKTHESSGD